MSVKEENVGVKRKIEEEVLVPRLEDEKGFEILPRPEQAKPRKRPVIDAEGHVVWRTAGEDTDSAVFYKIPKEWFGTVLPARDVFLDAIQDFPYLSTRSASSWLVNANHFVDLLEAKKCPRFTWSTTGVPIFTRADMTIDSTLFE